LGDRQSRTARCAIRDAAPLSTAGIAFGGGVADDMSEFF
jgi:hypothetical protein